MHLIYCKWCNKFKYQAHAFDTGAVTKKPTCTENGARAYTCTTSGCGYVKQETINATGHSYVNGICTVCKSECSSHSFVNYKCTLCGLTCTHSGFLDGVCKDCNYICSHSTYQSGVCTVCGIACTHPESYKYVDAWGPAVHFFTCTNCHTTDLTESHYDNDGDGICDAGGCGYVCTHSSVTDVYVNSFYHNSYCDNCNWTESLVSHSYTDGICSCGAVEEENCTHSELICEYVSSDYHRYVCSNCGHDFGNVSHSYYSSGGYTCECGATPPSSYDEEDSSCTHSSTSERGDTVDCVTIIEYVCDYCGAVVSRTSYPCHTYDDDGTCIFCGDQE